MNAFNTSCLQVAERLTVPLPTVALHSLVQLEDAASFSLTFEIAFPGELPGSVTREELVASISLLLASASEGLTLGGLNVSADQNGYRGLLPASK